MGGAYVAAGRYASGAYVFMVKSVEVTPVLSSSEVLFFTPSTISPSLRGRIGRFEAASIWQKAAACNLQEEVGAWSLRLCLKLELLEGCGRE